MRGVTRFPPRGPDLPGCMDYLFDLGVGELAPGHQVIARGICLHGGGLLLHYEVTPGLTAGETYRNLSQFSFQVSYEPTCRQTATMRARASWLPAWAGPLPVAPADSAHPHQKRGTCGSTSSLRTTTTLDTW